MGNYKFLQPKPGRGVVKAGTVRYAVRAAFSGAMGAVGRRNSLVPPALRGR
jgi:hypothetical protein